MSEISARLSRSLEEDVASSGWQTFSIFFYRISLSDTLTGSALILSPSPSLTLSLTAGWMFAGFSCLSHSDTFSIKRWTRLGSFSARRGEKDQNSHQLGSTSPSSELQPEVILALSEIFWKKLCYLFHSLPPALHRLQRRLFLINLFICMLSKSRRHIDAYAAAFFFLHLASY